jgi:hypothetical protein
MRNLNRAVEMFLVITLVTLFFSGAYAQDEIFSPGINAGTIEVGDFMEARMDMNEDGMEMSGTFRAEVTSLSDEITVKGTEYSVFTISFSGEGTVTYPYGMNGDWTASGEMHYNSETLRIVEETTIMIMTLNYFGQTVEATDETIIITIEEFSTLPAGTKPEIGDNWTETKVQEKTETITYIYSNGEEEISSETTTETIVTDYEYMGEEEITVPAGNFNCVVFNKVTSEDDEGEYTLVYLEKEIGFEVKYEFYDSSDEMTGEIELTAYDFKTLGEEGGTSVLDPIFQPDKEDDKGILNMGKIGGIDIFILFVLALIIIAVIAGLVSLKKREKPEIEKKVQSPQPQSSQQQYITQPYIQQQHINQAPISYYSCPFCNQPLTYITRYQRWFCYSCQRYT